MCIRLFQTSILLGFLVTFYASIAFCADLELISLTPKPNYKPYDQQEYNALVDKATTTFPMWIRKGSIGWSHYDRVAIEVKLKDYDKLKNASVAVIRLHMPMGLYAGIYLPERIDVYSGGSQSQYVHVGSIDVQRSQYEDLESHWIEIRTPFAGNQFAIVIQSPGHDIFLDEIEITPEPSNNEVWKAKPSPPDKFNIANEVGSASSKNENLNAITQSLEKADDINAVIQDAGHRLESFFLAKGAAKNQNTATETKLVSCDPYREYRSDTDSKQNTSSSGLEEISLNLPQGVFCVAFFPKQGVTDRLSITSNTFTPKNFVTYKLKDVVAANGEMVSDAAVPIDNWSDLEVSNDQANFFLFKYDASNDGGILHFQYGAWSKSVVISRPSKILPLNYIKPTIVVWSYSQDKPIWNNKDAALTTLLDGGVNLFNIHYVNTPLMEYSQRKDPMALFRFRQDVEMFKNHGKLLIEPEVYNYYVKLEDNEAVRFNKLQLKQAYFNWLDDVVSELKKENVGYNNWALYLIDEVNAKKVAAFSELASWTREHNSKINLYINPSATKQDYSALAQALPDYLGKIEIWQPRLEFAETYPTLFSKMGVDRWTYHNPPYPAKAADPLLEYRLPAIRAWVIGSKGIGVWSFDDSKGSSSWNDFDGTAADYSMVYEYGNTVIPSRRWLAFEAGAFDMSLLMTLEHQGCARSSMTQRISDLLSNKTIDSDLIDETLAAIIKDCRIYMSR